jgi:hypothetical protein
MINNREIERVNKIKYLGVLISENMSNKDQIETRSEKFRKSLFALGPMGINNKRTNNLLKSFLIKTYCLPILLYGIECTRLTITDINKINTTATTMIKKVMQINPRSQTEELMYASKIEPIAKTIIRRKLGFLIQLIENEVTRDILTNILEEIRKGSCNSGLTMEYINIAEYESLNIVHIYEKANKIKTVIEVENSYNLKTDQVINIRWLINNPTEENWKELHKIIMPSAIKELESNKTLKT